MKHFTAIDCDAEPIMRLLGKSIVTSPEIGSHLFRLKRPMYFIGRFVFKGQMWPPTIIDCY